MLQDVLLHAHLRFYISLDKILKKRYQLKHVKCKVMFTEAYLEPSRTSTMEPFCESN